MSRAWSHALAGALVVVAGLLFALVSYFGLLAWALLKGEPLGGALALPFMMLAALAGGTLSVVLVLLPATGGAAWLRRRLGWPLPAEIPLSTLLAVGLAVGLGAAAGAVDGDIGRGVGGGMLWALILLAPLGLYWWSLQATTGLLRALSAAGRAVARRLRPAEGR